MSPTIHAFTLDRECNLCVRGAAHRVNHVHQRQSLRRLAVQLRDDVARLDAGLVGGCVVHRANHLDEAILRDNLDADAAKFALVFLLHLAERIGIQVIGVRIKAGQHAVDRIFHQFLVGDRIDVLVTHPLEYIAKQREQPVDSGPIGFLGERSVNAQNRARNGLRSDRRQDR